MRENEKKYEMFIFSYETAIPSIKFFFYLIKVNYVIDFITRKSKVYEEIAFFTISMNWF